MCYPLWALNLNPGWALYAELGWKPLGLSCFLLSRGRPGSREEASKTELDCLRPLSGLWFSEGRLWHSSQLSPHPAEKSPGQTGGAHCVSVNEC